MSDAATWASIVGTLGTLGGSLGGFWFAGRNEEARDRRAAKREADARNATLAERLEEQRHTFQRDTLLELQDELQRLARSTMKIALQDQKTLKDQGQLFLLPPGLSDEALQIVVAVRRLKSRILDSRLRQAVESFVSQCTHDAVVAGLVGMPADQAIAQIERQKSVVGEKYKALTELLGEHLRRELDRRDLVEGGTSFYGEPGRTDRS